MKKNILQNKVAVITGGSRGLGFALAQIFAGAGARVVIASRSSASVAQAVAQLEAQGATALGVACDVGKLSDVEALAAQAVKAFGRIDIWVNNAGLSTPYGPTAHVPAERFTQTVNTNIFGTYYGSTVALRYFLPQGSGKLINLLGRGDRQLVPMQNAYAASKTWVRSFTLTLAKEYRASGVGIFAFNPGLVNTEMLSQVESISGYEHLMSPLKYVVRLWANEAAVPAAKALWLASSATDGRTGLEVNVLTLPFMLRGIFREGWRWLTRRQSAEVDLNINTVLPASMPPVK